MCGGEIMEWDIGYFKKNISRGVIPKRTITDRLIAWELDAQYYDGSRNNGYGGFKDDGRWNNLVKPFIDKFNLDGDSRIIDLGCKKGFILKAFKNAGIDKYLNGIENHTYPVKTADPEIAKFISVGPYYSLPFEDGGIDFVVAFSSVYMQTLGEVVKTLKEIQRVSNGNAYITLGAFRSEEEKKIFEQWTLIGTTVLHVDDWKKVMEYSGYSGEYFFTTPEVLGLIG